MYKKKIMTVIGFLFWMLGVSIPFFMNQSNVSMIMLAFGWLFPVSGAYIDNW